MDRQEFKTIVRKLEGRAKRLPRLYKFGVIARGLFGYFFFHLLLLASVGLIAGGVAIIVSEPSAFFFALLMAVFGIYGTVSVVRALSFRLEPPRGVVAKREQYAALWKMIDSVRAQCGNPRLQQVLLTSDFGASLVQMPRRGLITGYRNTLICGLPLMQQLDEQRFASVIAHELSHLAGKHGAASAWAYRLHSVWHRVLEQTASRPNHPMARFIRWYEPRFAAQSVVLRRVQEYEADRAATEVAGVGPTGDALLRTYLREPAVSKFWEATWRRAAVEPDAPTDVMAGSASIPENVEEEQELRRELGRSLAARTEPNSSHPSLADRLAAIGYLGERGVTLEEVQSSPAEVAARLTLPSAPTTSAAQSVFGERYEAVLGEVADSWAVEASEPWDHRHLMLLRDRGRLALLDRKAESATITADEAVERAHIVEALEGSERLDELLDLAHRLGENNAPALYAKGRHLIKRHDQAGVALLERAMELDPESLVPGTQLLQNYYVQQNQHDLAEQIAQRMDHAGQRIDLAVQERNRIDLNDTYAPHGFARQDVRRLISVLQTLPRVRLAYLARRVLQHYPEKPAWVLVLVIKGPWRSWKLAPMIGSLVAELEGRVRLATNQPIIFVLGGDSTTAALAKKFKKMPEHCIYRADGR